MRNTDNIDALKSNIRREKELIREAFIFTNQLETLNALNKKGMRGNEKEKKLLLSTIAALIRQLIILNKSIPELVKKTSPFQELPSGESLAAAKSKEKLVNVRYQTPTVQERSSVAIRKEDRERFLKELNLANKSVQRLKKDYKALSVRAEEFKKPGLYSRISNKFFAKLSDSLMEKGHFKNINKELRKANLYFLSRTYISMSFFTSFLALIFSIGLLILLLFFRISFDFPFLFAVEETILLRFLKNFWIVIAFPILTFLAFYFYPSSEKKSIAIKINNELPFVVIHMSAIAGSGVEPTKIFKIIVMGKEYPNTQKELRKLINEINVYGYDLVTALRNSARVTSSSKLSEVFKGLATTISGGGSLKDYLDKKADTLVFDYRIEREKYTHVAETLMDIYISVVIAAPMIMTMLLVMMSLLDLGIGLSIGALTTIMLLGIALVNIFFLAFLHIKQPPV